MGGLSKAGAKPRQGQPGGEQSRAGPILRNAKGWLRHIVAVARLRLAKAEAGTNLLEVALMLLFLGLLLLGVIDFGRAYYLRIEVANAAEAGALYGSRNPTDIAGIQSAATTDAPDVPGMTATATIGCECSDGSSSQSPCPATPLSCAVNVVNFVQVTTTATYTPIFNAWVIPGLPSSIALRGSAKVRQQY